MCPANALARHMFEKPFFSLYTFSVHFPAGHIPEALGALNKLEMLSLSDNQLTGDSFMWRL